MNIPKQFGYKPSLRESSDYKYGAVFKPLRAADLPDDQDLDFTGIIKPSQEDIPGCVTCTIADYNQWYSKINNGYNLELSWRHLFANTGPYDDGRSPKEVIQYAKDHGIPQVKYCPNDTALPENEFMAAILTLAGLLDAQRRKVGNYSWINEGDREALMDALCHTPVAISVGLKRKDWNKADSKIIKYSGGSYDGYHETELKGYVKGKFWHMRNWWGDGERKLDWNYPLLEVMSFRDVDDNSIIKESMFPTMRAAGKDRTYLILETGKSRIADSDTLHFLIDNKIASDPVEVSQAQLDAIDTLKDFPSVRLMDGMAGFASTFQDIFLDQD